MKLREIEMNNYTAYVVDQTNRDTLRKKFPPKYSKSIGNHVTISHGVPKDTQVPSPAQLKVIGYVDSEDGLEALIVSVNGSSTRPDGKTYHITWSLDPEKYSPKDSNELIRQKRYTILRAIPIITKPEIL